MLSSRRHRRTHTAAPTQALVVCKDMDDATVAQLLAQHPGAQVLMVRGPEIWVCAFASRYFGVQRLNRSVTNVTIVPHSGCQHFRRQYCTGLSPAREQLLRHRFIRTGLPGLCRELSLRLRCSSPTVKVETIGA